MITPVTASSSVQAATAIQPARTNTSGSTTSQSTSQAQTTVQDTVDLSPEALALLSPEQLFEEALSGDPQAQALLAQEEAAQQQLTAAATAGK